MDATPDAAASTPPDTPTPTVLAQKLRDLKITQQRLADLLGVTVGMVGHWCTGRKAISAERAGDIEAVTGGIIRAAELRPDVFGDVAERQRALAAGRRAE